MFSEFNQKLKDIGYNRITPFQNKIVETIYNNKNIVLSSKNEENIISAIFLASLMKMDFKSKDVQCLFIIPDSENVYKRISALQSFIPYHNLKIGSIVETMPLKEQLKMLQNEYQIIVGTPLRMKNLVDSELLNVGNTLFTIVECLEEISNLNLLADLDLFLYSLKIDCQKIFLCKNFAEDIIIFLKKFDVDFSFIKNELTNIKIEEPKIYKVYSITENSKKYLFLKKILKRIDKNAIIFVKDLIKAKNLYLNLKKDGFKNIQAFSKEDELDKTSILITDTFPDYSAEYVINYDFPSSIKDYEKKSKKTTKLLISLLNLKEQNKDLLNVIMEESRLLSPKKKSISDK